MSKRHNASRRRSYARRQHEVRERRELPWPAGGVAPELVENGYAPADVAVEGRAPAYGGSWVGLD
jgi:hypothetical protein